MLEKDKAIYLLEDGTHYLSDTDIIPIEGRKAMCLLKMLELLTSKKLAEILVEKQFANRDVILQLANKISESKDELPKMSI